MVKFFVGMVFGLVIATIGFAGVVRMFDNAAVTLDKGVSTVKEQSIELAR